MNRRKQEDSMNELYRQGDVLIQRVKALPKGQHGSKKVASENGRIVLAYGEVTGHSHAVVTPDQEAELFELIQEIERYLVVNRTTTVVHEEHGAIELAPGVYRVWIQLEYQPGEIRNVSD
jgi:hypothetical protein